jgi:hypothetical protein
MVDDCRRRAPARPREWISFFGARALNRPTRFLIVFAGASWLLPASASVPQSTFVNAAGGNWTVNTNWFTNMFP